MKIEVAEVWKSLDIYSKGIPEEFINHLEPVYRDTVLKEHLVNPTTMLEEWDEEEALNYPEGFKEFLEDLKKVQDANDAFYIRFVS